MKIHDVIRTRRQALGLTQEGLADRLGVSAPAVNKWERGVNYPDITLLPALARTLGVDLNTLLSFQEDMSREEMGLFINQLSRTAQEAGCAAAFALAKEKLREFPNNDQLAYGVAGILEAVLTLYPEETAEEQWKEEIDALYGRALRSKDPKVREWAAYTIAAHCIAQGELERGESLLEELSDTHREKQILTASLREKQGRQEEAWALLEGELFNRSLGLQAVIVQMTELAWKEGEKEQARSLAETATAVGRALDLTDFVVLSAPLQLALREQNAPLALDLLEKLLHSMAEPWKLQTSPLYRHLPIKRGGENQGLLLQPLLHQMETDPETAFLRNLPEYQALVERFQSVQP